MKIHEYQDDCQIPCLRNLAEGPQESTNRSFKLSIRRFLGPRRMRLVERYINNIINWYARLRGKSNKQPSSSTNASVISLKAGDWVRIRSLGEIEITLDHFRRFKGCSFAPEMVKYCDTEQQVLKPVERFVDERDLRILRTKGIVILDGLTCQGMGSFGRCDRNCSLFWREEWLEKIDGPTS